MKQLKNIYRIFEEKWKLYYSEAVKNYNERISRCRDEAKNRIHNEYLNGVFDKRNKAISDLGVNGRFFLEIRDELERDKEKQFDEVFNRKAKLIPEDERPITLNQLSQAYAYQEVIDFLQNEGLKYEPKGNNEISTSVKWTGETEVEFVHLIYALFELGYMNNDKHQITKLVEEVATLFKYKLKNNWQATLSDSVHNRKADYEPKIFDKLKEAFDNYRKRQEDKRNKNSPK